MMNSFKNAAVMGSWTAVASGPPTGMADLDSHIFGRGRGSGHLGTLVKLLWLDGLQGSG